MECGNCTACCDSFSVGWLNKPIDERCVHCDNGCKIHNEKPTECTDYNCTYAQVSDISDELRPDNCGIIFEKHSNRIIFGTVIPNMETSGLGHRQIQNFLEQGFSVVLSSSAKKSKHFMISDKHNEGEIKAEFGEIVNGYL